MAVPPVLIGLGLVAPNALNQSGRGGRDRQSKFYELSGNLRAMITHVSKAGGTMKNGRTAVIGKAAVPAAVVGLAAVTPASSDARSLPRTPTEFAGEAGLQARPRNIGYTGDGTAFLGGFTGARAVTRPSRRISP
jgi:hypothetical protein